MRRYRPLFTASYTKWLPWISLLGHTPNSIMLFGSVLAVQELTGSLLAAGIAGGLFNVGIMIGQLAKGWMLDHHDKAWAFLFCAASTLAAALSLMLADKLSAPAALALIFMLGLGAPPVDIWMRAVWGRIYPGDDQMRYLASGWETFTSYAVTVAGTGILALTTWLSGATTALLLGAIMQILAAIAVSILPIVRRVPRPNALPTAPDLVVWKICLIKALPSASQASQRVALVAVALSIGTLQADSFAAFCTFLIAVSGTAYLLIRGAPSLGAISINSWSNGLYKAGLPAALLLLAAATGQSSSIGWIILIIYALLAGYAESRIGHIGLYLLERHSPDGYHNRSFSLANIVSGLAYLLGSSLAGLLVDYIWLLALALPALWLFVAAWLAKSGLGYLDQKANEEKASG